MGWGPGKRRAAALAAVLAAGVACIPAVSAIARTSGGESEAARASLAQADAEALLSDLQLPEGAVLESSDPSVGQRLPAPQTSYPARPEEIIEHRYWRVPREPQEVLAWIEAHNPTGARGDIRPEGPDASLTIFRFTPRQPEVIAAEDLRIDALPAEGGGTALRLEGEVGWFAVRPASERIPAHVKLIRIVEHEKDFTRRPHYFTVGSKTISKPAIVKNVIAAIEALEPPPPADAERHHLADKRVRPTRTELEFRASSQTELLAKLVIINGHVLMWVGAKKEPSLSDSRKPEPTARSVACAV